MTESQLEKQCTSCGESGHHYNECSKVPFYGLVASAFGVPTQPVCGMNEDQLEEAVNENAVWNQEKPKQ